MLNEVIKGVSMKLNATFGNKYRAYENDVKQGLKPPCFFIAVLNSDLSPLVGRRYVAHNPLDVRFIPADRGRNSEMFSVAAELLEALEYIILPDGDMLRGTGMNYEIVDGVLHFFVDYNLTLIKPAEEVNMETLDVDMGTI
ncbi:MAG: tail completion protein [Chaetfec virus UA24_244]|nr:MAG: tail completion protein [Chaetfec virus UA24_244]